MPSTVNVAATCYTHVWCCWFLARFCESVNFEAFVQVFGATRSASACAAIQGTRSAQAVRVQTLQNLCKVLRKIVPAFVVSETNVT